MEYREGHVSRIIYNTRELIREFRKLSKKAKKRWGERKVYVTKTYWTNKKQIAHNAKPNPNLNLDSDPHFNSSPIEDEEPKGSTNNRLAVYTCVFGNYDKIREPLIKGRSCDYYIVTDQEIPPDSAWKKIEPLSYPKGFELWHPAIKNRYYKMHPHEVFTEYEYSLYLDGNVQPITDLYPLLVTMINKGFCIALFEHPIFDCLYDAAEHLKKINLVDHSQMDLQTKLYCEQGFPQKYGFFECSFILRKHHMEKCRRVMDTWWTEYLNGVKRDQQSFTYSLWKNHLDYSEVLVLGANVRENSRIKIYQHVREHQKV